MIVLHSLPQDQKALVVASEIAEQANSPSQTADARRTQDPLPEVRLQAAPRRSLGLHPALRDLVREYARRAGITDDTGTEV